MNKELLCIALAFLVMLICLTAFVYWMWGDWVASIFRVCAGLVSLVSTIMSCYGLFEWEHIVELIGATSLFIVGLPLIISVPREEKRKRFIQTHLFVISISASCLVASAFLL